VAEERRAGRGYAIVLLLVVASFVFAATAPDAPWSRGVFLLISIATLVVTLWVSHAGRWSYIAVAAVLVATALASAEITQGGNGLASAAGIASAAFVLWTIVEIARGVAGAGTVNRQSVLGAVAIYLLLGILFMFIYSVVALLGSGPFFAQGTSGTPALRLYFSFITLTTVGYGDYTAASSLGHTLSIIEALLGQLYLVTVVAVLVSRLGSQQRTAVPPDADG